MGTSGGKVTCRALVNSSSLGSSIYAATMADTMKVDDFARLCSMGGIGRLAPYSVATTLVSNIHKSPTPAEDMALEKDLLADEKELAEHLMLVDLARNDIGRVCTYGSIRVPEKNVIERYSHVMHIVSQVEGQITAGRITRPPSPRAPGRTWRRDSAPWRARAGSTRGCARESAA